MPSFPSFQIIVVKGRKKNLIPATNQPTNQPTGPARSFNVYPYVFVFLHLPRPRPAALRPSPNHVCTYHVMPVSRFGSLFSVFRSIGRFRRPVAGQGRGRATRGAGPGWLAAGPGARAATLYSVGEVRSRGTEHGGFGAPAPVPWVRGCSPKS